MDTPQQITDVVRVAASDIEGGLAQTATKALEAEMVWVAMEAEVRAEVIMTTEQCTAMTMMMRITVMTMMAVVVVHTVVVVVMVVVVVVVVMVAVVLMVAVAVVLMVVVVMVVVVVVLMAVVLMVVVVVMVAVEDSKHPPRKASVPRRASAQTLHQHQMRCRKGKALCHKASTLSTCSTLP
jgi:hypothetical protein